MVLGFGGLGSRGCKFVKSGLILGLGQYENLFQSSKTALRPLKPLPFKTLTSTSRPHGTSEIHYGHVDIVEVYEGRRHVFKGS